MCMVSVDELIFKLKLGITLRKNICANFSHKKIYAVKGFCISGLHPLSIGWRHLFQKE